MSDINFEGKTVVVTGGGGALGGAHAKLFASRGANVVVNDLGGDAFGTGSGTSLADKVVDEIKAAGGNAIANYDTVSTMDGAQAMVKSGVDAFGSVHVLVNNAGILRDVSFKKMSEEDWDKIFEVHVKGAFCTSKAVWEIFREQNFGRIINTTSAAGIYGNFGQANYSAAKMSLIGLSQTLALEGAKYNIHTNAIAPVAGSRLTATVMPPQILEKLKPEAVSPLVGWLCSEECKENGALFEVGAGAFFHLRWQRGKGFKTAQESGVASIEELRDNWSKVTDLSEAKTVKSIAESTGSFMA